MNPLVLTDILPWYEAARFWMGVQVGYLLMEYWRWLRRRAKGGADR